MNSDDIYDPESWEGDYELYEAEDWVGLLNLREKDAKKHPSDLYAQQRYADALNLNNRYKDALDFITPLYKANYEFAFGVHEIVDALYGLGKTEDDFNWVVKPDILNLNSDMLKLCVDFLKPKRKSVSVTDIYCDLIVKSDCCIFNEQELGNYLVSFTNIFDVQLDSDYIMHSKLKLKRK